MKIYVAVTDNNWFDYLSTLSGVDEVNFWRPSPRVPLSGIHPGELFLFKLHSPRDYIAGGGIFAHYTTLPISIAWESFGEKNGAPSFLEMREKILQHRNSSRSQLEDFEIGCIIVTQPFFFEEADVFTPPEWHRNIQTGKYYPLEMEAGKYIWKKVENILNRRSLSFLDKSGKKIIEDYPKYGKEMLIKPRLGQGSFRILVSDAYNKTCAITSEKILPVLEAAHIKPYAESGPHEVNNGVLLRSDMHKLFDKGYLTITPQLHIEVSRRIKDEFDNGEYYFTFHGKEIHPPPAHLNHPSKEYLSWHNEKIFR
jgi:putative restriction endonuclease